MSEQDKITKPKKTRTKKLKNPVETVRQELSTLLGEPSDWKLRGNLMLFILDDTKSAQQLIDRYVEVNEKQPVVWMWYEQAVGFKI